MRMKKGIITISTIAVVIVGVFFAVRFIGNGVSGTNEKLPKDNSPKSDNLVSKNNSTQLTNGDEQSKINPDKIQDNVASKSQSAIDMDSNYINDKTNVGIYTVKKEDTVFSIVKTYMPNYDKSKVLEFIKNRNNIDVSFSIKEGQKIVIPYEKEIEKAKTVSSEGASIKYKVKKEDTLSSIAKINMPTYNIKQAIDMIKTANKIEDENAIKEGSFIFIPK